MENADCVILHIQVGKHVSTQIFGPFDALWVGLLSILHSDAIEELKKLDGEEFYE